MSEGTSERSEEQRVSERRYKKPPSWSTWQYVLLVAAMLLLVAAFVSLFFPDRFTTERLLVLALLCVVELGRQRNRVLERRIAELERRGSGPDE